MSEAINLPQIELRSLDELVPYAKNARTHSKAQVSTLRRIISEFGWTSSVLVDGDNGIIAGHGRCMAAKAIYDEGGSIRFANGAAIPSGMVPVIECGAWTAEQRKAYIIADNASALSAGWDEEVLALELKELEDADYDLTLTGLSNDEIDDLLDGLTGDPELGEGNTGDDETPEAPEKPVSQRGDRWLLGKHVVVCGDATNPADLKLLMGDTKADMIFTDPPYGVSARGARDSVVEKKGIVKIKNDELTGDRLVQFLKDAFAAAPFKAGGSFYVCYDQRTQLEFLTAIDAAGLQRKTTIIWNKNNFGLSGSKGYRPKFELIAFGHSGREYQWFGGQDQADVWDIPRPTERPGDHPTPKPVDLALKAILNSSKEEDIVLDMFGGSGTTLIACEKSNRCARVVELEPAYVDVHLIRWQDWSGMEAIHEATGMTYAEIKAADRLNEIGQEDCF